MFSNQALRRLILPLIAEQILTMLVGMADTAMVSYAGEAAISGVALVDMVSQLIITVLSAVATGGAVIVSQYLGSRNADSANRAASQLQTLTLLVSAALMGICLLLHRQILQLLFGSIEPDVMQAAVTYFVINALSFPFLGVYQSAAALFRSMERTQTTMYVSLLMNAINVVGNAIGIFGFRAGVVGVAVPTLISRVVAGIVMLKLSLKASNPVRVNLREMGRWDGPMQSRILKIALPNGLENGLFTLGRVLVTSIVALFGTAQIAANGVSASINSFAIIIVNAINLAVITVVGQCIGAKEFDQAQMYLKKLMKISYLATGALTLVVWALLPLIRHLYSLSPETWCLCAQLVMAHNIMATLLHPTSFNLANGLRAAGDVKCTLIVGIGSMLVFRLGTAYLLGLGFGLGIWGVYAAMGMDWLGRSVAFVLRFRGGKWKEFRSID